MKKLFTLILTGCALGVFAQNILHDAKIIGSVDVGNKQITSVLDETTGCSHKSTLHTKNLFVAGESVKIDIKDGNGNESEIIKPNLPEVVFIDKCHIGNPQNDFQMTPVEFKENVAILDARVRSINPNKHIREIILLDFSNHNFGKLKKRIIFDDINFSDEGTGHDKVANDGIYTSNTVFDNGDRLFQYVGESKRALSNPIVSPEFKHQTKLDKVIDDSNLDPSNPFRFGGKVKCDFGFNGTGCPASDLGWCDSCCLHISNCSFTLSW